MQNLQKQINDKDIKPRSYIFLIAQFIYNNIKNININYILFKLNYNYHTYIFYKKNIDFYLKSKYINKLANELKKLWQLIAITFNICKTFKNKLMTKI